MKKITKTIIVLLSFIIISCENSNNDSSETIKIITGGPYFKINKEIDITLTNTLGIKANYFLCDSTNLSPTWILKYDNGKWTESSYPLLCNDIGEAGYYGTISNSEIKHDTISLFNVIGEFKLRYRFVVGNDTLSFDSNVFYISGYQD